MRSLISSLLVLCITVVQFSNLAFAQQPASSVQISTAGQQNAAPVPPSGSALPPASVPPGGSASSVQVEKSIAEEDSTGDETPVGKSEFQDFIERSLGYALQPFGRELFSGRRNKFTPADNLPPTADYLIGPGDEIVIRAWGQVELDTRTQVTRSGDIFLPRVGTINVAGIRYDQLQTHIRLAVERFYRNFELQVAIGELRSIRVFVVGHAVRPGSYAISNLGTVLTALFAAGGASSVGSMRRIQLKRRNKVVGEFDLYDLLMKGDSAADTRLLPGDIVYIPPAGSMVAISGSIKLPGIYELNGDTTSVADLIEMAGGPTPTAQLDTVSLERIADHKRRRIEMVQFEQQGRNVVLRDGDLIQVPHISGQFDNAVTLRGHVARPGRYPYKANMTVRDLLPGPETFIVPEYWDLQNTASRRDVVGRTIRTEIRRTTPDVNWDYAVIERLNDGNLTTRLIPFNLGKAVLELSTSDNPQLQPGDIVTIFSQDDLRVPLERRSKFVRLEGEVARPGVYRVEQGETLRSLVMRTGGLTNSAFLFGSFLKRETIRQSQQGEINRFIQRLETSLLDSGAAASEGEQRARQLQRNEQLRTMIANLRELRAEGRLILGLQPIATVQDLPEITLEDGDVFEVPSTPKSVTVIGSVYQQGTFLLHDSDNARTYLERAGGVTKNGDSGQTYVLRANGAVVRPNGVLGGLRLVKLLPGDTIIVPERVGKPLAARLQEWSQMAAQLALGVAALRVLDR